MFEVYLDYLPTSEHWFDEQFLQVYGGQILSLAGKRGGHMLGRVTPLRWSIKMSAASVLLALTNGGGGVAKMGAAHRYAHKSLQSLIFSWPFF